MCEIFAALKGKCDVKSTRQRWMAELKPAVNTNVLHPVHVSFCRHHHHHLSLSSDSLSLCSSLLFLLTWADGARGIGAAVASKISVLSLLQWSRRGLERCLTELNHKQNAVCYIRPTSQLRKWSHSSFWTSPCRVLHQSHACTWKLDSFLWHLFFTNLQTNASVAEMYQCVGMVCVVRSHQQIL